MSHATRTITILGATGSIGTQTLDVLDNLGDEAIEAEVHPGTTIDRYHCGVP